MTAIKLIIAYDKCLNYFHISGRKVKYLRFNLGNANRNDVKYTYVIRVITYKSIRALFVEVSYEYIVRLVKKNLEFHQRCSEYKSHNVGSNKRNEHILYHVTLYKYFCV